ncbi:TIGR03086 family metal-binding protein [Streptomyces fuscigenes]|uniref:TIGR03086 family metal-binding protein n=1 Tax=Streptomyces fuscigenes TaxID=1528880 RepID=UPI001F31CBB1|nr:TIGR03086 family metal-binding protein [Streptomyces fuscigenes]MCF3963577.1 TIGR03086 family metal-binding protein [Streptomyces fuscigenes]
MASSALQLIPAAVDRFGARVHAVDGHRWNDPTPCSEWTVRDLVNHLVGEHLWAPHLLAGESLEQVGDRYDGDVLGSDPVRAWDEAAERSLAAWEVADPAGTARFSFGEAPLSTYADQMLVDLTVHEWDLARGAGLPESLDPAAVGHALDYARANAERMAGAGITAAPVPTTSGDPAVQLLSLLGRAV